MDGLDGCVDADNDACDGTLVRSSVDLRLDREGSFDDVASRRGVYMCDAGQDTPFDGERGDGVDSKAATTLETQDAEPGEPLRNIISEPMVEARPEIEYPMCVIELAIQNFSKFWHIPADTVDVRTIERLGWMGRSKSGGTRLRSH